MKNMYNYYESFAKLVFEEKIYENPIMNFVEICNLLSVAPKAMEEMIYKKIGYCGDELINQMRTIKMLNN